MNWIDSHRRLDKDATVRNSRFNHFLFVDELVLHAWIFSTGSSARIWSVLFCVRPCRNENQRWKIEVLCLSRRPRQCFLQVNGNTLQQVKTFKYLGVVFTSDESPNKGIDRRIGKTNAVLRKFLMQVGNCQVLYKKYSRRPLSFNLRDQNPLHENIISSRSNSVSDDATIKSINRCRVFAENHRRSLNWFWFHQ